MKVYVIGSLRNPRVPQVADELRNAGFVVFDDWYAAGPEADDYWQKYEQARGHSYQQALKGHPANHVFEYDKHHLDTSQACVLVTPAGKSGHLEFGYMIGRRKPSFILMEEVPDRWDVMYKFANRVCFHLEDLVSSLRFAENFKDVGLLAEPGTPEYENAKGYF